MGGPLSLGRTLEQGLHEGAPIPAKDVQVVCSRDGPTRTVRGTRAENVPDALHKLLGPETLGQLMPIARHLAAGLAQVASA